LKYFLTLFLTRAERAPEDGAVAEEGYGVKPGDRFVREANDVETAMDVEHAEGSIASVYRSYTV
jgi:hypothetical protein